MQFIILCVCRSGATIDFVAEEISLKNNPARLAENFKYKEQSGG